MGKKKRNYFKLLIIFLGVFIIATIVSMSSEIIMRNATLSLAWVLLLFVILIGIIFDIIGTAAAAATESPHHASAANRVKGARQSVYILRHADTVASFTNDIVGDIAGTLSGAMGATIVADLIRSYPALSPKAILINTLILALVASLTVTGKALGKTFAISEANQIIALVGKLLATFEDITGLKISERKKRGGRKNGLTRKNK